ncbi:MAG: AAA family ATPase [Myxococcales bacterium]|nr:AAA family ATPase [Myxococcales bacterium]MCB9526241.1 AAA family ATPase [Myxococcales bacterium]
MRHAPPLALCLVGVPGVGKSTLLHAVTQDTPHEHVVGSSVVKAVLAPKTVADLDRMPPAAQAKVRHAAIARLAERRARCAGVLLVDGHCVLRDRHTGRLRVVFTEADRRFYDALVHLDGAAARVAAQIAGDPTRARHGVSATELEAHLLAERNAAAAQAERMGVPFLRIEAEGRGARQAALLAFLEGLEASL